MLYCCNKYYSNTEKKYLLDTATQHNQILEYGICPKCNILKAVLTFTDNLGRRKEIKPKKRKAKDFINQCLNQPYYELKDLKEKYGTKNNMFWIFQANGQIRDFNNTLKGYCKTELTYIYQDTFQDNNKHSNRGAFLCSLS